MLFRITALLAGLALSTSGLRGQEPVDTPSLHHPVQLDTAHARQLDMVIDQVVGMHLDSIDPAELRRVADTVVNHLGDSYTRLERDEQTKAGGDVGLLIAPRGKWPFVVAPPLIGMPGDLAGIRQEDQVIAIDGKSTEGWSRSRVLARAPVGTRVILTIRRPGLAKPFDVTLRYAAYPEQTRIPSVGEGTLLRNGIGYIPTFAENGDGVDSLLYQIERLHAAGMRALILDLRHNRGGAVDIAAGMGDIFVDSGGPLLSYKTRMGSNMSWHDGTPQRWPDLPIVALVGNATASGGEGVGSILRDYDRALLLGTPSFGKGVRQATVPVDEHTTLRVTTGTWNTPAEHNIHRRRFPSPHDNLESLISDSALTNRPFETTLGGRRVRGGGNLVPDVVVATAPPRADSFRVTAAMRRTVEARPRARGVMVSPNAFASARDVVNRELGYAIAGKVFGWPAELRRRLLDDRQVQAAVTLLDRAKTPETLRRLATSERGYTRLR